MGMHEKAHRHFNGNGKREEEQEEHGSFDVISWLEQMGKDSGNVPQFLPELGGVIEDVVNSLRHVALKKGGEASGKVTVEFALDLEGTQVYTTAKISAKTPGITLNKSTAYIGPGGRLVDQDPKQININWQGGGLSRTEVKGATTETRTGGSASGGEIKAQAR